MRALNRPNDILWTYRFEGPIPPTGERRGAVPLDLATIGRPGHFRLVKIRVRAEDPDRGHSYNIQVWHGPKALVLLSGDEAFRVGGTMMAWGITTKRCPPFEWNGIPLEVYVRPMGAFRKNPRRKSTGRVGVLEVELAIEPPPGFVRPVHTGWDDDPLSLGRLVR